MKSYFDAKELEIVRRAFAKQVLNNAGISSNGRLESAFVNVCRENFLGLPPWRIPRGAGYQKLPSDDPVLAYQDVLFAIDESRKVNNGSPSLHAAWLNALSPKAGENIVHIGAGLGYYTALLAELVGAQGSVLALEYNADLAAAAKGNLGPWPQVTVVAGDGALWPREQADCIYVNFGVTAPAEAWIENLALGGRLIFPIGLDYTEKSKNIRKGTAILVERKTAGYSARSLGPAFFIPAEGQLKHDEADVHSLRKAFEKPGLSKIASLLWKVEADPQRCWFHSSRWSLSFDELQSS